MGEAIITGPLYAPRKKVGPQAVHGQFRRIKWSILAITLGIYYLLPFVRWDRGPGLLNQAALVDSPHCRSGSGPDQRGPDFRPGCAGQGAGRARLNGHPWTSPA